MAWWGTFFFLNKFSTFFFKTLTNANCSVFTLLCLSAVLGHLFREKVLRDWEHKGAGSKPGHCSTFLQSLDTVLCPNEALTSLTAAAASHLWSLVCAAWSWIKEGRNCHSAISICAWSRWLRMSHSQLDTARRRRRTKCSQSHTNTCVNRQSFGSVKTVS